MQSIKLILKHLTAREKIYLSVAASLLFIALIGIVARTIDTKSVLAPIRGGSYAEGIVGQPIMVNPIMSDNPPDLDLSSVLFAPLSELASTLDVSSDGRSYSLKLKEDLKWDDGEPLTSDDIIFTIETIQKLGNRSPLIKEWQGISAARVSELQVTFSLPTPYFFFSQNISKLRIIPRHIFSQIPIENFSLSAYNFEPVGSGPYKVKRVEKKKDGFITDYILEPNSYYVGTAPYIEEFSFRFYSSLENLIEDAKLRRIQGFGTTSPLPDSIRDIPLVTVDEIPMPRYYALFMNSVNNPALKDPALRNALNKAIHKEQIVTEVLKGKGAVINDPLFRTLIGMPESDASVFSYDPEEAARTIGSLKQKDIKLSIVVPEIPFLEQAAEQIRKDLIAAGIAEVDVYPLNTKDIGEVIKTRNYELLLFGNILENPRDLFPFWHSSLRFYPGMNFSLYQNLSMDKLLEGVRQTSDETKQMQDLIAIKEQFQKDNPAVFLFSMPYFYVHSSRLEGFSIPYIANSSERFSNIREWNVQRVRVLQKDIDKMGTSTVQ